VCVCVCAEGLICISIHVMLRHPVDTSSNNGELHEIINAVWAPDWARQGDIKIVFFASPSSR